MEGAQAEGGMPHAQPDKHFNVRACWRSFDFMWEMLCVHCVSLCFSFLSLRASIREFSQYSITIIDVAVKTITGMLSGALCINNT